MTTPQRNTRFIWRVLYTLKKRYGGAVTFVRDTESLNTRTGKKTVTKTTKDVRRAIILPNTQVQKFVYDLSYIANAKNFTYGAIFDTSTRKLILDSRDLGTYVPQQRDYFTFENDRWNVIEVHKFEFNTGYLVVGQRVEGASVRDVHNESARVRCIFSQSVAEVLT